MERLTPERVILLESTKSKITKDENGKNLSHLEITKLTIIIIRIQESFVHLFVMNHLVIYKIFLLKNCFLKTFNLELSYIEVWFSDQNSERLEIEDKTNSAFLIK